MIGIQEKLYQQKFSTDRHIYLDLNLYSKPQYLLSFANNSERTLNISFISSYYLSNGMIISQCQIDFRNSEANMNSKYNVHVHHKQKKSTSFELKAFLISGRILMFLDDLEKHVREK